MPRVLVGDDLISVARLTVRLFQTEGVEAAYATSGAEALSRLAAGPPPDVVLLDINMPEMDGLEVLRLIRSEPRHQGVAVVMYTALGDNGSRRRAEALGADAYLIKTCPWEQLRDAVMFYAGQPGASYNQTA